MPVVVESPARAGTLRGHPGAGHAVIATRGHVQDLAAKGGAVDPARDFAMVHATGRGDGAGMRRAGIRDVAWPGGKVSAERAARTRVPPGEGPCTCRCHRPLPATALTGPCRLHRMPPAHERSGDRQYPCGSRSANEDRRGRENAGSGPLRGGRGRLTSPMGSVKKSNWMQGTAVPPEAAAHPPRMRPCRDAGTRAMSIGDTRYRGYRAAERTRGGRKAPAASDRRGISVSCAKFRAARGRSLRFQITRDSCCYRA